MINIAYIIDEIPSPTGGTEGQLVMLLRNLDRKKFRPFLVCLRPSAWLTDAQLDTPILVLSLNRLFGINAIRKLFTFRKFCRRNKIDIVQTFFVDANIFGTVAGRFAGVKAIISSRRNLGYWHNRRQISILRFLGRWTNYYLANSHAVVEKTVAIEGARHGKIGLIYNGLDLEKYRSLSSQMREKQREDWHIKIDELLIGALANLRPVKRIDLFIRVAADLIKEFPHLKFVVVGDGPEKEALLNLINESGLNDKFLLAGTFADTLPCLCAFDIGVLCSRSESFSNSLIEYMAAGLPSVASDVGGNGEAITDGQTGLLFPVDESDKFKEALRRLIREREFAGQLGQKAKEEAFAKYAVEICIDKHEQFYSRILEGKWEQ
jgi:L-malate glycosyltransferase